MNQFLKLLHINLKNKITGFKCKIANIIKVKLEIILLNKYNIY
jgi:hypothetical protein